MVPCRRISSAHAMGVLTQTLHFRLHGTEMRPQHPHTKHTTHMQHFSALP